MAGRGWSVRVRAHRSRLVGVAEADVAEVQHCREQPQHAALLNLVHPKHCTRLQHVLEPLGADTAAVRCGGGTALRVQVLCRRRRSADGGDRRLARWFRRTGTLR
jgi:hypothetical protein